MTTTMAGRVYVTSRYGLELDGVALGLVEAVEGGYAKADIVETVGPDRIARKRITGVKYEDITVTCGLGMAKGVYDSIRTVLDRNFTLHNGAIVEYDYNNQERSRLSFFNALVTEIAFPALDASSKAMAQMTIKFTPEYTRMQSSAGASMASGIDASKQKQWLACNFRLQIAGLDCKRVDKIGPITVKQKAAEKPGSELQDGQSQAAQLDVSNLVITLPEANAKDFYDWHDNFLIKGNNGVDQQKSGTIEYLTPDLKEAAAILDVKHLGICRLAPEKIDPGSDNVRRIAVEMFCEEVALRYGATIATLDLTRRPPLIA